MHLNLPLMKLFLAELMMKKNYLRTLKIMRKTGLLGLNKRMVGMKQFYKRSLTCSQLVMTAIR